MDNTASALSVLDEMSIIEIEEFKKVYDKLIRVALSPDLQPGFDERVKLSNVDLKDLVTRGYNLYHKLTKKLIELKEEKRTKPIETNWAEELTKAIRAMQQPSASPMAVQQPTTIIQRQPIRVPTFDGEPRNFRSYWTRFETLIDKDQTLSKAEKINLLFEGLHAKTIALINVDPTEDNYEFIKDCLQKEYGVYKTDLYTLLRKLQSVKTAQLKATDCEKTYREIKALLRQIETVGGTVSKEICLSHVLPKFPFRIVGDIIMDADATTSEEILNALHEKIVKFKLREEKESFHDGERLNPIPKERNRSSMNQCAFCGRINHATSMCRTFASVTERRDQVKKRNLCWICFSNKHNSRNCTQPKCSTCQLDHNMLLCNKAMEKQETEPKGKKPFKP
ncbi:unnamed protein product, partial [Auanema sp. JU1783]